MKKHTDRLVRILLAFMILFSCSGFVHARIATPAPLLTLTSEQGLYLLKRDLGSETIKLLANFTTQKSPTYCGIASAVMILNALDIPAPKDSEHPPFRYFTQDNFFNDRVLAIIKPEQINQSGVTLYTLGQLLKAYDLQVKIVPANQLSESKFRKNLMEALANNDYIIVNFSRPALNQEGGGHHSPIAAYDRLSDRFLVLDVARYKYASYWVKAAHLWRAVDTHDGKHYRGYLLIKSP